jgi:hypothetical protein
MHIFLSYVITSITTFLLIALSPVYAINNHAPLNHQLWSYATDPYGSEAIINEKLIRHDGIWIKFKRVPRVDVKRNSWIELIHSLPQASMLGNTKIRLTYQCDIPLLMKLSQKEYGKKGDQSYAHYQIKLPATQDWETTEVDIKDFYRPSWTPINSKDYGILTQHIDAIYLTPSLTDKEGGEATLQVSALKLLP